MHCDCIRGTSSVTILLLDRQLLASADLSSLAHFACCSTMKYGKYDLHKCSANVSVGTSYSWYYRKCESTRKKSRLTRAASDSTLFSDYANQISLFEKENLLKKCKKSVSDVGKNTRVKYVPLNIKPVHMEPFFGNFFYGKPLPGYEYTPKTEEKITYLPDSDAVTASEDTTAESLTTAHTVVDMPTEFVKNPLYGCADSDVRISTPEYLSSGLTTPKDSQFKSSSCSELRNTMTSSVKESDELLSTIIKDYKRIMKEWNHTLRDHCSSKGTMCKKRNTDNFVRSFHSSLSCRKPSKCTTPGNKYNHYSYIYPTKKYKKYQDNFDKRKTQSLNRNQTFSSWKTTTLQTLKKKSQFWKVNRNVSPSECKCLEAIYEDYDRRLQEWCDTISECSTLLSSVL